MGLSRIHEEHEVSPEVRRIYEDIRTAFDAPFVPALFKQLAGEPEYLRLMWDDLHRVVCSREFQAATKALQEFTDSVIVEGGLRFTEQQRVLAAQKFSASDAELLRTLAILFARVLCQMALFGRLLQRGYSGGQRGRVNHGRQAAALSRLVRLNIPREDQAGIRAWLIFGDMRRVTRSKQVPGAFRVLAPFPSYLASVWLETKQVFAEPGFLRARDEVNKRTQALIIGLPVRDHRSQGKRIAPDVWREIEQIVDAHVRMLPQFVVVGATWSRSFTQFPTRALAA